jgi:hypothetical protein
VGTTLSDFCFFNSLFLLYAPLGRFNLAGSAIGIIAECCQWKYLIHPHRTITGFVAIL